MKKLFLSFSLLTLIHAQGAKIDADLGIGYRSDWIDYPIFDADNNLDLDFTYNEFNMPILQGNFKANFTYFLIFANASYGRFWDGKGVFSSVPPFGVDRETITLKTAGHATIAKGGGGFPLPFYQNSFIALLVIPVAGYRYDHIRFKQMNPNPSPLIDFNDTGALYHTIFDFSGRKFDLAFEGPFAGSDIEFKISNFWISGGYTYHWTRRKQQSVFDLLSFDSSVGVTLESMATLFAQTKKTRGHFAHGTLGWQILENFYIAANGTYMNLKTKKKQPLDSRQVLEAQLFFPPFNVVQSNLIQDPFELEWTFFTVVFKAGLSI